MGQLLMRNKGFTLIEVLLYLSISSVLLFAVGAFVTSSIQARAEGQVIAEVEQQGQAITQNITSTIRTSSSITSPTIGTSAAGLTLATYVGGTNPTIYSLASGTLSIKEGAGSTVPLNNAQVAVSALTFTNVSYASTPGTVRVQFTIGYNGNVAHREYNYSKVFYGSANVR